MKTLAILSIGAVLSVFVASEASAASLRMLCTNPHQGYLVVFDTVSRALVLDPDTTKTKWVALAHEKSGSVEGVAGMVGQGSNLGFYAEFSPKMQVELFSDDKIVQTDPCKPASN